LSCTEELKTRPFILNGLDTFQFQIKFDEAGQPSCELREADEELFRSFLMTFRKFIMKGDADIDWVLNFCRKHVKPDQKNLKETLEEIKEIWKYQYRKGTVQMRVGNVNLSPEYALDLFINGQYFHSNDNQKSEQLRKLSEQSIPCARIQLLWSLPGLTKIILATGSIVSKALKENAFNFPSQL